MIFPLKSCLFLLSWDYLRDSTVLAISLRVLLHIKTILSINIILACNNYMFHRHILQVFCSRNIWAEKNQLKPNSNNPKIWVNKYVHISKIRKLYVDIFPKYVNMLTYSQNPCRIFNKYRSAIQSQERNSWIWNHELCFYLPGINAYV